MKLPSILKPVKVTRRRRRAIKNHIKASELRRLMQAEYKERR